MASAYRTLSHVIAPFIPLWLELRRLRGKEDATRGHERLGHASLARPAGTLLWLHAASVGEANSVLHFIGLLRKHYPTLHILLTTGTVTSAELMNTRLPQGVMHQYVPVDTPSATARFMRHWRPDIALWVESEFWPNLIYQAHSWHAFMGIINGRMSERSFRKWNKRRAMIEPMLGVFDVCFAQSKKDGERLAALGVPAVDYIGNLKYDAAPLEHDESQLAALKRATAKRPLWLAASTHPGEEAHIATTHKLLKQTRPDLLTIIVPRHPARGTQLRTQLEKHGTVAQRSGGDETTPKTEFYLADTLGELGLFYRLADIVYMGGSLVPHGGQNPLEPARLSCAILTGPHTHNFTDIYAKLSAKQACVTVQNPQDLAAQVANLLSSEKKRQTMQQNALGLAQSQTGAAQKLFHALAPAINAGRNI